jgi:hypothetical protein
MQRCGTHHAVYSPYQREIRRFRGGIAFRTAIYDAKWMLIDSRSHDYSQTVY